MIEKIPLKEAEQIGNIVSMTIEQLQHRYSGSAQVLRGVHAKDHGCAEATFTVLPDIKETFRHGIFATPGQSYAALIRFSNAAVLVRPDSEVTAQGAMHGSRGMAVKLFGVSGPSLGYVHGSLTQDFLMVNHPVFVFANVEDYEVLSRALLKDGKDDATPFFIERLPPPNTTAPTDAQLRALETAKLAKRIQSNDSPPAFQAPPASPVDNDYFGAAPFMLGPDQVMRFRVRPTIRSDEQPLVADPNYLRTALIKRLQDKSKGEVVFKFEIQVRAVSDIDPERDIENASRDWSDEFTHVANITLPLQEIESPEKRMQSERLFFTPWHGLEAHRPLGGINRLRRAVYEASAQFRNLPKEASLRCPFAH